MRDTEILPFHDSARCLTRQQRIATEKLYGMFPDTSWPCDGKISLYGNHRYETSFEYFLGKQTFQELLQQRPYEHRNVLDLYGSGFVDIYDEARCVIAVRLRNTDAYALQDTSFTLPETTQRMARILSASNRHILEGNLLHQRSWHDIESAMRAHTVPAFDLIFCRPHGPFEDENARGPGDSAKSDPTPYLPIYLSLLNRAYRLLSPNYGQLYTQIPEIPQIKNIIDIEHRVAKNLFDTIPGVHATPGYERSNAYITYCLKLVKTPKAPSDLTGYFQNLSLAPHIQQHP